MDMIVELDSGINSQLSLEAKLLNLDVSYLPSELRQISSSSSDEISPKETTPEIETGSSCCSNSSDQIPLGYFNDPEFDIVEDSPEFVGGRPIPRVLIPNDIWQEIADKNIWTDTFCIPARMGGVLIGRYGKNVRELRSTWKAEFTLNTDPRNQDMLLFKISCPVEFKTHVLQWVSQRFKMRPSRTTIGNPHQLKRHLSLGVTTHVHVRSSYGLKEMFVTIPDEKFVQFMEMQNEMNADYSLNGQQQKMQLCEPVTTGTVAVLSHGNGFSRALMLKVFVIWPVKYALYFLLDHGTFGLIQLSELKKIRAKYMKVPFQCIHVSWAHALPIFSDIPELHLLRTFFSSGRVHATPARMETCCRASVVFTDMIGGSLLLEDNIIAPSLEDMQAFPPLGMEAPVTKPEVKVMKMEEPQMVDILANVCHAGLFIITPLVVYPSRQCWINQSETPYYAYIGGEIDYKSLVTFLLDDGTALSSPEPEEEASSSQLPSFMMSTKLPHARRNRKKGRKPRPTTASSSNSDKENRQNCNSFMFVRQQVPRFVPPVTPSDINNNASVQKEIPRPANNPWGLKHDAPSDFPAPAAPVQEASPSEAMVVEKEKPSLADIVASTLSGKSSHQPKQEKPTDKKRR